MAGEIFVGSVSVGVVPDLSGFNDRLRAELVPSANEIGRQIGEEIGKGIADALDIGKIINDSSIKASVSVGRSAAALGTIYGQEFRKAVELELEDISAKVKLNIDNASLIKVRAAIRSATSGGGTSDLDALIRDVTTGGRGGGGAKTSTSSSGGFGAFITGLGELLTPGGAGGARGLSTLTSGFGALPLPAQAGVSAAGASVVSLIAQAISGGVVTLLGGALTGIGIYGALSGTTGTQTTPGQLNVAQLQLKSAQDRLAQLQAGTTTSSTTAPATALSITAATDRLSAAQDRLSKLQSSGKTTAEQLASAEASVASSQNTLNNLQAKGSTTTKTTAASAASLASAQASVASAQQRLNTLQANAPDISKQQQAMHAAWTNLTTDAQNSVKVIGASFVPVLQSIFTSADQVMLKMTPVFASAEKVISGPFKVFADAIITSFGSPQVQQSIQRVAGSFSSLLTAFTPDIPGVINSFADAITRIANAVSKNPKAFADFLNFFFQIGIAILDAVAFLTFFADYVEQHFLPAVQSISHGFQTSYRDTINETVEFGHEIESIYDSIGHEIESIWDDIWNNTVVRAEVGKYDLLQVFVSLKTDIINWFYDATDWLHNAGQDIINGLLNGIKGAMADIGSWLKTNVVDPIINSVKHWFGIHSPAAIMLPIGRNIMAGLINGILSGGSNLGSLVGKVFGGWPQALGSLAEKGLISLANLPEKALKALGSIGSKIGGFFAKMFGGGGGSGVQRWAGIVAQALGMLGLPLSLGSQVLYQMQTESGGNQNAINLTDINAQMGDPSRGLMQVIGSTFAAYHVAGTSMNIYDPLANIAAAINYARAVYGPTLLRGGMGIGSGHGYDEGGWLPAGASWAWNGTGRPELVMTADQVSRLARGGDGASIYHAHFDGLTGAAIESHVRSAFQAMTLTEGQLQRQGRRI